MSSYKGEHLWIHHSADHLDRDPREASAIQSHTCKAYRKWIKDERTRKLLQGRPFPFNAKTKAPRDLQAERTPIHPRIAPHAEWEAQQQEQSERFANEKGEQSGSQSRSMKSCQSTPSLETRAPGLTRIPRILLMSGNSDPFRTTALKINPTANELLTVAQKFYVFYAWQSSASKAFQRKSRIDLLNEVNDALACEPHLHALFAGGAHFKENNMISVKPRAAVPGAMHKIRSMATLRETLTKDQPLSSTTAMIIILRLLSLEFYEGNFEAADLHYQAAKSYARAARLSEWVNDVTFSVLDVWIAAARVRKPLRPSNAWDPGTWWDQRRASGIPVSTDVSGRLHEAIPNVLRQTFFDIRELLGVKNSLPLLVEAEKLPVVEWLAVRSAALKGRLLEMLSDFKETQPNWCKDLNDIIFKSAILTALLFLSVVFCLRPTTTLGEKLGEGELPEQMLPSKMFAEIFRRLRKCLGLLEVKMGWDVNAREMLTWGSFILCLASELRPPTANTLESRAKFIGLCAESSLCHVLEVEDLLAGFLYDWTLMDRYLTKIIRNMQI